MRKEDSCISFKLAGFTMGSQLPITPLGGKMRKGDSLICSNLADFIITYFYTLFMTTQKFEVDRLGNASNRALLM